ncbi:hypothetical protein CHS0354_016350 [Potamilus streckersoni]|uniref:Chitin-binding type-4 domain-containing protein n=1 Tax=Potamilus streckersoni TaxID=2493646 RepID=A0AAE0SNH6_9BIVA|nr:hypothetical protein CHS0354_016350 [Potamilus streckersoni]
MWKICTNFWCVMIIILEFLIGALGHGMLVDPPARNYMGEAGFDVPVNYNGNSLNCGGMMNQWQIHEGKCGLCGDPYQGPRHHEPGGIYATGTVGKCYTVGTGSISVRIRITAYHGGYFEFRLCTQDDPHSNITQSCLDRHVLTISGTGSIKYDINSIFLEYYVIKIDLPDGITCKFCVLQWKYNAENSWGCDESGCGIGRGHQEQFYNCADIAILPSCLKENDTSLGQADAAVETNIAMRANPLQSGTYLDKTDSNTMGRTICNGVGVWKYVSSMAAWCTHNCLGPTKYCPDSLCACKQLEENATEGKEEYKPKNTTVAKGENKMLRENGIQEDQALEGKESQIPKANQAYKVYELTPEQNILEPDHRKQGTRVTHVLYLFDPVASGLVKRTNSVFSDGLFSPSSENSDGNSKGRFFESNWKSYGGHCWLSKSHDGEDHTDIISNVMVLSGRCRPSENRLFEVEVRIKGFNRDNGWKCSESDCDDRMEGKTINEKHDEFTNCLDQDCAHKTAFLNLKKDSGYKEDSKPVEKQMLEMSDSNVVRSRQTQGKVSSTEEVSKCILDLPVEPNEIQLNQDSDKTSILETRRIPSKEEENYVQDGKNYDDIDTIDRRKTHSSTSYKMTHAAYQGTTDPNLVSSGNKERLDDSHVCYGVGQWAGSKDMDDWCMYSCFHSDPYCPEEYCACSIPDPVVMGRNMNQKKKYCTATMITTPEKDLTDWCNIGCNNNPPYCPSSLCLCE